MTAAHAPGPVSGPRMPPGDDPPDPSPFEETVTD